MPSRYGFTTKEEKDEGMRQLIKKGEKIVKEISPFIVDVLEDYKKANKLVGYDVGSNICYREDYEGSDFGRFGLWILGHRTNKDGDLHGIEIQLRYDCNRKEIFYTVSDGGEFYGEGEKIRCVICEAVAKILRS